MKTYKYYIQLNMRPHKPGTRHVWPKLFDSEKLAWEWITTVYDSIWTKGVKSVSVQSTLIGSEVYE